MPPRKPPISPTAATSEAKTRKDLIDPALKKAGWDVDDRQQVGIEIPVDGFDPAAWQALHAEPKRIPEAVRSAVPDQAPVPDAAAQNISGRARRGRWESTVGRPVVQGFAGSLDEQKARKGVMITTSQFSQDAHRFVDRIEKKIALIDGERLTQLMIEYNVGVAEEQTYIVKKIDLDYFGDE